MKKIALLSLFALITNVLISQGVPQKINYQAVAHDGSGELLTNTAISVDVTILSGSSTGTIVYSETHAVTTNEYGLFYFKIGNGSVVSGTMSGITWGSTDHFLNVQVNGDDLGTVQLVSVPYALQAGNASAIDGNEIDAATPADGEVLVFNGITGMWEAQPVSGSGDNWGTDVVNTAGGILTGDGTVGSPLTLNSVDDADADATNEIQDLQLAGNILTITNNGSATSIDLTPYLELPTSATTNEVLTWNGTNWVAGTVSGDNWGTDVVNTAGGILTGDGTVGSPLTLNSVDDADADATNEIQDLQLVGNSLTITNNGSATTIDLTPYLELPASATTNQVLTWDGTGWVAGTVSGDNWGTQTVNVDGSTITGDGDGTALSADIQMTEITDVALTTPSSGEVLEFDGTNWINVAPTGDDWGTQLVQVDGVTITGDGDGTPLSAVGDDWGAQTAVTDGTTITGDGSAGSPLATDIQVSEITDVVLTTPTSGEVLEFDGTNWINVAPTGDDWGTQLVQVDGVTITGDGDGTPLSAVGDDWGAQTAVTDGTTITGDGSAGSPLATDIQVSEITDVVLTTPTSGEVLEFDGTNWINVAPTGDDWGTQVAVTDGTTITGDGSAGSPLATDIQVSEITDVVLTTPTSGEVLEFDGTNWINVAPTGDDWGTQLVQVDGVTITGDGDGTPLSAVGDDWGAQTAVTDGTTITGDGSAGSPLAADIQVSEITDVVLTAPASGEVLEFDGTNWVNVPVTGEANTASNVGLSGVGPFFQKNGTDLEFKNISAASSRVTITDDVPNMEIDIDVDPANIFIGELGDVVIGTATLGDHLTFDGTNWVNTPATSDGNGIYDGDGTVPSGTLVTLTDNIDFGASTLNIDGTNGRVGIGTAAPQTKLHVMSDGSDNEVVYQAYGGTPVQYFIQANGTSGSPSATTSGTMLGNTLYFGEDGSGPQMGAQIATAATENWTGAGHGTRMGFATVENGTIGNPVTRMIIDHNGHVGINEPNPGATLDVNGTFQYTDGNEAAGYVLTSDAAGNASWQAAGGAAAWELGGNIGTIPGTNTVGGESFLGTFDGSDFLIATNSTPALWINGTDQRIGIGNQSPQGKLHVTTEGSTGMIISEAVTSGAADESGSLQLLRARGSVGSETNVLTGDRIGSISFNGYGSGMYGEAGYIAVEAAEDFISTGSGGKMTFSTTPLGLNSPSAAMVIDENQNIGMGITVPAERVHIFNGSLMIDDGIAPYTLPYSDGDVGYVMQTDGAGIVSWVDPSSLGGSSTRLEDATLMDTYIEVDAFGDGTEDFIHFGTTGIDRMVIDNNGMVGIGTTTPGSVLHVGNGPFGTGAQLSLVTNRDAVPGGIAMFRSRGNPGGETAVLAGDEVGYIEFSGHDGTSYGNVATIRAVSDENYTGAGRGTRMEFEVTNIGGITPTVEMVLDESGYLGVGNLNPTSKLHVEGDIALGSTALVENAVTVYLINNGGPSVKGDIAIIDPGVDGAFTTTSSQGHSSVVGVVYESGVANGQPCKVAISGVALVNADVATTRGQHVITGSTAGLAGSVATPGAGTSIGIWLENVSASSQGYVILK